MSSRPPHYIQHNVAKVAITTTSATIFKTLLLLVLSLYLLAVFLPADSRSLRRSASPRYRVYHSGGRGYRRSRRRQRFRGLHRRRRIRYRRGRRAHLFPTYYPYYYGGSPYPADPYDYGNFYGARQPDYRYPNININVNVDADVDCSDNDDNSNCDGFY